MKKFELFRQEKGSFLYDIQEDSEELHEIKNPFRTFYAFLKKNVARLVKAAASKFKKLKPGKSVTIKLSLPSNLFESNKLSKMGGELAELALLDKLYDLLVSDFTKQKSIDKKEAEKRVRFLGHSSKKAWKSSVYNGGVKGFNDSAKKYDVPVGEKKIWIANGHKGAELFFSQFKSQLGDDFYVTDFELIHEGVSETGKSKRDFAITLKKHSTQELEKFIGVSMKASEKGTPYSTPGQAMQTGFAAMAMGLITGKYNTDNDDIDGALASFTRALTKHNKMVEDGESPEKIIAQKAKCDEIYKRTYLAELDKQGQKLGYDYLLGDYLYYLGKDHKHYLQGKKSEKKAKVAAGEMPASGKGSQVPMAPEFHAMMDDYVSIIEKLLKDLNKTPSGKNKLIEAFVKFGGIEEDLHYVAAGIADPKGDAAVRSAVSTLYNKEYETRRDSVLVDPKLLEVQIERASRSKIILTLVRKKDQQELITFDFVHNQRDVHIKLPKFDGEKLLKKYGSSDSLPLDAKQPNTLPGVETTPKKKALKKFSTKKSTTKKSKVTRSEALTMWSRASRELMVDKSENLSRDVMVASREKALASIMKGMDPKQAIKKES